MKNRRKVKYNKFCKNLLLQFGGRLEKKNIPYVVDPERKTLTAVLCKNEKKVELTIQRNRAGRFVAHVCGQQGSEFLISKVSKAISVFTERASSLVH